MQTSRVISMDESCCACVYESSDGDTYEEISKDTFVNTPAQIPAFSVHVYEICHTYGGIMSCVHSHAGATPQRELQRTATHCNSLQHTAKLFNNLQHPATHCNTHCNTIRDTYDEP